MENQVEIWKSHPDIDKLEVSTLGRVRTLDRVVSGKNRTYLKKGHILKQRNAGNGYMLVHITINGKQVTKLVHRLVAQAFISNPDSLPEINHKDCDKTNNDVSNLEWCTRKYNVAYREKYGASQRQPVFAVNLSTLKVSRFRSQNEAGRELGVSQGNINMVIKGKRKYANGFWFVNDDGHAVDIVKSKLHDVGGIGLKIKHRATLKIH